MQTYAIRSCIVVLALLSGVTPALAQGRSSQLPASPEILEDGRVTFRVRAPNAGEVMLNGEFMSGNVPLTKGDDGVWSVTVGPIEPEIYGYSFVVDGLQSVDQSNPDLKYRVVGGHASLLDVPGDEPRFFDAQDVPHGGVAVHWYTSGALDGAQRRLFVYTPPGYESMDEDLPVLYLLHGAGGDDAQWTWLGQANLIMDNLLAAGRIEPMIVAMPNGYAFDPVAVPFGAEQRAGFERDLLNDIIPLVEGAYRVRSDRDSRAIAGLSMGGGQSLMLGLRHLDRFSYIAAFSTAMLGISTESLDETAEFASVAQDTQDANRRINLLWLGCGTEDFLYDSNEAFSRMLAESGLEHTFRTTGGIHNWVVWRRYLNEVAPLLFR